MIIKILNKFFTLFNLKIISYNAYKSSILYNVFNSKHEKHVLISYIKAPFIEGIKFSHSNYLECYTAAEIFHELEFNVDVINLDSFESIDYSKYHAVYGVGLPLENAFYYSETEKIIKIFYATGCMPFY